MNWLSVPFKHSNKFSFEKFRKICLLIRVQLLLRLPAKKKKLDRQRRTLHENIFGNDLEYLLFKFPLNIIQQVLNNCPFLKMNLTHESFVLCSIAYNVWIQGVSWPALRAANYPKVSPNLTIPRYAIIFPNSSFPIEEISQHCCKGCLFFVPRSKNQLLR
jgi:hypothetical protein